MERDAHTWTHRRRDEFINNKRLCEPSHNCGSIVKWIFIKP